MSTSRLKNFTKKPFLLELKLATEMKRHLTSVVLRVRQVDTLRRKNIATSHLRLKLKLMAEEKKHQITKA